MDIDIDKFRNKHDNEFEWDLKRNFLLTHKNSLNIDQLECLTNCYANAKLYGCTYVEGVMNKLSSLEAAVPRRERIAANKTGLKIEKPQNLANNCSVKKIVQNKKINKLKKEMGKSPQVLDLENRFKKLKQIILLNELKFGANRSAIEILTMSGDKAHMPISTSFSQSGNKFICDVLVDQVLIGTGEATNKKSSKLTAFTEAVALIKMNFYNIQFVDSKYKLMPAYKSANLPFKSTNKSSNLKNIKEEKRFKNKNVNFLSEFVIREYQYADTISSTNFISQLHMSSSFNRVEVKYNISQEDDTAFTCVLTLDGVKIAKSRNSDKSLAKSLAAEAALIFLKKKCYTIIFKKRMDAEYGDTVDRDVLIGKDYKNDALPTSNIGNKLLRKQGWTGSGGIGKTEGISEPIFLDGILNREGLGLSSERGLDPQFSSKVTSSIIEYTRSDKQDDLVFSSDFTKDERCAIHQIAKKFHLATKSYGTEGERILVLSRKRTPVELLKHVEANNGETHKYLLIPPLN